MRAHYANKLNHKFQSLTIKKQNNVFDLVFAKRLVLAVALVFVNQIFFIYNYLFFTTRPFRLVIRTQDAQS